MRRFSLALSAALVATGVLAAPAAALTRVVVEQRSVAPLLFDEIGRAHV